MKILYKLLIAILVPFLLINLMLYITTTHLSNKFLSQSFSDKSLSNLVYLEKNIKQYFVGLENIVKIMTRLSPPELENKQESKTMFEAYLSRIPSIYRISAVDLTGEEWLRVEKFITDDEQDELQSLFYSSLYQVPMLQHDTYLGEIAYDDVLHENLMNLSLPIKDSVTGKTSGVLWLQLSFQSIYELFEQNIPDHGKIILVYQNKTLLEADASPQNLWENEKLIQEVNQDGNISGVIELSDNKVETTLIYKNFEVKNNPFKLILVQPNNVIFSLVKELQHKNIIILIFGIIIFMIFISWIIHLITSPLLRLINQMNRMSMKYDAENKGSKIVDKKEILGDEVLLLEKTFKAMKAQISSFQKEEEKFKSNLEKQVENKVKQIRYQAYHDTLTGLPNRRLFNDRLEMAMAYADRHEQSLAVMFLDLDDFKNINDTEGHHVGDMYLKDIALRLMDCCREEDTVSRFGGDEFIIILPDVENVAGAEEVAQRIIDEVSKPTMIEEHELFTSGSIGITLFPRDGRNVGTLIKNADIAMYSAKEKGKNSFAVFSQTMNDSVLRQMVLEKNLRKAVEKDEFVIHYQPKVAVNNGDIYCVEALVRWRKSETELVSPAEFIPIAEDTNIIYMLGDWVLKNACKQAVKWQRMGIDISVAINISAKQFQADSFQETLFQVLYETGMNPKKLVLEITENTVMGNVKESIKKMINIRRYGIKISIDDFGTGYSSLSYLKQFPVDMLKIDRSFVKELKNNSEDAAITFSIISLAHSMNLKVVAEGVENVAQMEILKEFGCDYLQGYLFSRPVEAKELDIFLQHRDKYMRRWSEIETEYIEDERPEAI